MSAPFRLNRNGLLLALISTAFAGEAGAAAARVDFVHGSATVSGVDGRERPLARGAELDTGDTVRTTGDGRAQLRFSDGAYVSLQPNTEFAIKEYRFEGRTDGSERGLFALAKGAMRTVTGLVGRVNRDRYQITTPTATVGIRGTGGAIQILNDGSTLVIGTSGIWSLTNPFGSVDVPARTNAIAPSAPNTAPTLTTQPIQSSAAPIPDRPLFTQGEQRDPTGNPLISTFKPLQSGPGYTAGLAGAAFDGGEGAFFSGRPTTDATFNGAGQLTELANFSNSGNVKLEPGGSHAEFGTDGILAWGRWIGPVTITGFERGTVNYGPNEGLHYVVGAPTPVLPTTGGATYSLAGATSPTVIGGAISPGSVTSGSLSVSWGSGAYDVALQNFGVAMSNASYKLDGSARIVLTGSLWSLNPVVTPTGGNACFSGCSATANGFFAGANAERAGMVYHINDFQNQVTGAAAFKKN